MFTEIGIENFKAFGKMQRIPLKPITLLYGPNSSGKSSLMQALLMLKQTLEESNDPQIVLLPKGNLVDLGGYQEFIHKHNPKNEFKISVSFKYSWALIESWGGIWDPENLADLSMEFTFAQDKTGELLTTSIKIGDSFHPYPITEWKSVWQYTNLKRAVLKRKTEFENDGESPQELIDQWLSNLKRSVMVMDLLDLNHYLLKTYWDALAADSVLFGGGRTGDRIPYSDIEDPSHKRTNEQIAALRSQLEKETKEIKDKYIKLNEDIATLTKEGLQEEKEDIKVLEAKLKQIKNIMNISRIIHHSLINKSHGDLLNIRKFPTSSRLIAMVNCFPSDKDLHLLGNEIWPFQRIPEFAALGKPTTDTPDIYDALNNISNLLPDASLYLKEYLRRIVYIGPLREYPERVYSYSGNSPSNVGKSGKYTPDILLKRQDLRDKVNEWFDRFEVGYHIKIDSLKRNLFSLSLLDKRTNCEVSTKDVGFGIGQILPILVQGILSENKIIFIEQPEIHIHPRLQSELGSFIAMAAGRFTTRHPHDDYYGTNDPNDEIYGNQFIIETHICPR